ncbi:uncharacterized protein LOC125231276 [Leguminivora glycinivorella]|uniref:uncharacterized protein LOC125231276 n=1 Tax=Leguminivora glycinivorella TaxID=1035111 RepID=UPI002010B322|nr:uncharacterized protein LOC125231276 [Leguminivora glycinivorella]
MIDQNESSWRKSGEWKSRYSQLYSCRLSLPKEEEPRYISFMENDSTPYNDLLMKLRSSRLSETPSIEPEQSSVSSSIGIRTILSRQSDMFPSCTHTITSSLGRHDTLLLDMVRERNRELQEAQDQPLDLPADDASEDLSIEPCMHGMSHRITDRSVSRSRFSRISTKRDMDIPSILAFNIADTPPTNLPLGIPAFQQKESSTKCNELPRWSIRRSVCPVCSQKWRDRSFINKIKNSGLKRNALQDIPSVIAPARLRSAARDNSLRPVPIVEESPVSPGLRSRSASWQLIRARRIRMPKPQLPSSEAPPCGTAPNEQKDLNMRVNNFLST